MSENSQRSDGTDKTPDSASVKHSAQFAATASLLSFTTVDLPLIPSISFKFPIATSQLTTQMAGYFSNHSQSRFLANSQGTTTTSTTTTTTTLPTNNNSMTPATSHPTPQPLMQTNNQPSGGHARPTRVPSRHFSTSLSGSGDEKFPGKERSVGVGSGVVNGGTSTTVHPLRHTYVRTLKRPISRAFLTLPSSFFLFFFPAYLPFFDIVIERFFMCGIDGCFGSDNTVHRVKLPTTKKVSRKYLRSVQSVPSLLYHFHHRVFLTPCFSPLVIPRP